MEMKPAKRSKLTLYIGMALIAGIAVGFILNKNYVGTENNKIANADLQLTHIDKAMLQYETVKDTAGFTKTQAKQKMLVAQKKEAEASLLGTSDETTSLATIKILSDSLRQLQVILSAFTDTSAAGYKTLQQQRELVAAQKSNSIKSRDSKLDWFTILADIFLRLIKMIVAPLVFTTLVVGVAKLGDIKAVGRIGGKT